MDAFYLENFSTSYRFPVNHLPQLCPAIYLFVMLLTLINIIYNGLYSNQNWLGLFYLFSVFFLWWVTWASRHWCQIYPPKDKIFETKLKAESLEHFWLCLSLVVFKAPNENIAFCWLFNHLHTARWSKRLASRHTSAGSRNFGVGKGCHQDYPSSLMWMFPLSLACYGRLTPLSYQETYEQPLFTFSRGVCLCVCVWRIMLCRTIKETETHQKSKVCILNHKREESFEEK